MSASLILWQIRNLETTASRFRCRKFGDLIPAIQLAHSRQIRGRSHEEALRETHPLPTLTHDLGDLRRRSLNGPAITDRYLLGLLLLLRHSLLSAPTSRAVPEALMDTRDVRIQRPSAPSRPSTSGRLIRSLNLELTQVRPVAIRR